MPHDYDREDGDLSAGQPFQHVPRSYPESYTPPDPKRYADSAEEVSYEVCRILAQTFGSMGMTALFDMYPDISARIEASVLEAYTAGHYRAWGDAVLHRSDEAMASSGRMLSAILKSAARGESTEATAVRILAGNAGVDEADADTLVAKITPHRSNL